MTKDQSVIRMIVQEVVREELNTALSSAIGDINRALSMKQEELYVRYRDDVLNKLDRAIGHLRTIREEQEIHQYQHDRMNDNIQNLQTIHPGNKHL